jgi:hypothetical protein
VAELLGRISSEELTEWAMAWKIRREEEERSGRASERNARARR